MLARRHLLALAIGAAIAPSTAALAQEAWPAKPIKLVVPFAAGGNTDTIARLTAEHLTKALPANIVVENQTGAAGMVAANEIGRAHG